MKLVTLVLLAAASAFTQITSQSQTLVLPASGQSATPDQRAQKDASGREFVNKLQNSQAGCPVVFTEVALKRNAHYLPVKQTVSSGGNLDFQYKNESGKQIQSISIEVEVKAKRSLYDLDAMRVIADMVLTDNSTEEPLPPLGYVYGIDHLTLERVRYADGTVWNAPKQSACHFGLPGGAEQIGKLW
jgi:hypothetical protein